MAYSRFSPDVSEAIVALNGVGWSDAKIGRALGKSDKAIQKHRRHRGILANPSKYNRRICQEQALELWSAGLNDAEIARQIGVSPSGICHWRQRHDLMPNLERAPSVSTEEKRTASRMLLLGASKRQAADEIGRSRDVATRIRRRLKGDGLRRAGLTNRAIRAQVLRDKSLYGRIQAAVGAGLPSDILRDAVDELYLEVLSGRISSTFIDSQAKRFRAQAIRLNGWDARQTSLDQDRGGWSLGDYLEDPTALCAFEPQEDMDF